jgi:hypothetical protein
LDTKLVRFLIIAFVAIQFCLIFRCVRTWFVIFLHWRCWRKFNSQSLRMKCDCPDFPLGGIRERVVCVRFFRSFVSFYLFFVFPIAFSWNRFQINRRGQICAVFAVVFPFVDFFPQVSLNLALRVDGEWDLGSSNCCMSGVWG